MNTNTRKILLSCALSAVVALPALAAFAQTTFPGVKPVTPLTALSATNQKAVVINDLTVLQNSGVDFSLGRTLGLIIKTSGGAAADSTANRRAFLQTMISTFSVTSKVNPTGTFVAKVTPRPGEAALNVAKLLTPTDAANGMRPVALVNRLDLAPADWSNCGQYRIVYAKGDPATLVGTSRFFLNFEAVLDNPHPELGAKGCLPIAQFWASLKTLTGVDLAKALAKFYYSGGIAGVPTVVNFKNYGNPFGSVRANMFVNNPNWMLREWVVKKTAAGSVEFAMHTVQNSPNPVLYGNDKLPAADANITALRKTFQANFTSSLIPQLVAIDKLGKTQTITDTVLVSKLGVNIDEMYLGFESNSSLGTEDPASAITIGGETAAAATFRSKISSAITAQKLPWPLNNTEVLERAGTQTCGGCHHFSSSDIAPASDFTVRGTQVNWPETVFVHVRENGAFSDLVRLWNLPVRFANLNTFISAQTAAGNAPGQAAPAQQNTAMAQAVAAVRTDLDNVSMVYDKDAKLNMISAQIEQLRAAERNIPGAFTTVRPTD